jgi:hypothetical protein
MIQQHILMFQQRRVFKQAQNLTKEGYRLLIQLLGVSNVRRDDFLEGDVSGAFCKLGSVLLRPNSKFPSDCVLSFLHVGVYVVDVQTPKVSSGRHRAMLGCQQYGGNW